MSVEAVCGGTVAMDDSDKSNHEAQDVPGLNRALLCAVAGSVVTLLLPVSIHVIAAIISGLVLPVVFYRSIWLHWEHKMQKHLHWQLFCWIGMWTASTMFIVLSDVSWMMLTLVLGMACSSAFVILEALDAR